MPDKRIYYRNDEHSSEHRHNIGSAGTAEGTSRRSCILSRCNERMCMARNGLHAAIRMLVLYFQLRGTLRYAGHFVCTCVFKSSPTDSGIAGGREISLTRAA